MAQVLYDDKGEPVTVGEEGAAPSAPVTRRGFLPVALDGGGLSRFLKSNASGRLEQVLYDSAGNAISSRLDIDGNYRLYTTLQKETVSVSFGGVPSSAADIVIERLMDGGSADMLVDGSVTAVDFTYSPSSGKVGLDELRFFLAADNVNFDGASFGPISALTNGVLLSVVINSTTTDIATLSQNEDFGLVGSPRTIFYQNSGPNDSLALGVNLSGLVLDSATSDQVRVRIRDDLTNVKFKFFESEVQGVSQ